MNEPLNTPTPRETVLYHKDFVRQKIKRLTQILRATQIALLLVTLLSIGLGR